VPAEVNHDELLVLHGYGNARKKAANDCDYLELAVNEYITKFTKRWTS